MSESVQAIIFFCLIAATLLPMISCFVNIFFGKKMGEPKSGWFAVLGMAIAFGLSIVALLTWWSAGGSEKPINFSFNWLPLDFNGDSYLVLGCMVNTLTLAMMVMVTGVSTLVHVYSIGYMHGDKRFHWFFAYLSLFTFSMLGIVIANSLLQLFVFWELVGLTSYLLIGFWFEKRGPQLACKKAFVMNRIGDAGFLVGFGILFAKLGGNVLLPGIEGGMSDALATLLASEGHSLTDPPWWLTVAGIGLFCGAIGKSAQFPLHTWLPDAMEGPTPVSSIVHSATMVAAGVFLTGRIYPILTPGAHLFIATIGLITLVMAACMALVMTDIKKVLAYSTLSQLGYMILGLGVGAWTFALFHLITHAFFKCCLFQCSGSVINACHHEQDMKKYGGLADKMPMTALAYAICTLAISGASIPLLSLLHIDIGMSGYYSKDGIVAGAINYGEVMAHLGAWGHLFWIGPVVIAYVTPFYMARSFALTFLGDPRDRDIYDHAKEAPITMVGPQLVLSLLAIVAGWFFWYSMIKASEPSMAAIQGATDLKQSHGYHAMHLWLLLGFGWIISLGAGLWMYKGGFAIADRIVKLPVINQLYHWALNKFYFDTLYDAATVEMGKNIARATNAFDIHVIDRAVNGAATAGREAATIAGIVDTRVVDGAANGAADFAQTSGTLLRGTQSGRIRMYVLLLLIAVIAGLIITMASVLSRGV